MKERHLGRFRNIVAPGRNFLESPEVERYFLLFPEYAPKKRRRAHPCSFSKKRTDRIQNKKWRVMSACCRKDGALKKKAGSPLKSPNCDGYAAWLLSKGWVLFHGSICANQMPWPGALTVCVNRVPWPGALTGCVKLPASLPALIHIFKPERGKLQAFFCAIFPGAL
jgi:hypothetical protein